MGQSPLRKAGSGAGTRRGSADVVRDYITGGRSRQLNSITLARLCRQRPLTPAPRAPRRRRPHDSAPGRPDFAPRRHVDLMLCARGEAVVALRHLRGGVVPVPAASRHVRRKTIPPRGRAVGFFTFFSHPTTLRLLQPARTSGGTFGVRLVCPPSACGLSPQRAFLTSYDEQHSSMGKAILGHMNVKYER
jgi:hypothetical protein